MKTKLTAFLILFSAALSQYALGADEVLSDRVGVDGQVEAVVSGVLNDECAPRVNSPESVTSTGTEFSVVSSDKPLPPCVIPLDPPQPYEVVADLGVLEPGSYSVSWVQPGFFSSSIEFSVPQAPVGVPSTSWFSLVALVVALLVVLRFNKAFRPSA